MKGTLRVRRVVAVATLAAGLVAAMAMPVAGQATWDTTSGDLKTPSGVVIGKGRMTRFVDRDRTVAQVKAEGLERRTQYTAQVHTGPCSATPAGGAVYPGFSPFVLTTDRDGAGEGSAHLDAVAAPSAATIVLYDGATVIGCADLTP